MAKTNDRRIGERFAALRLNGKRIDRAVRRAERASERKRPYHLYIWQHRAPQPDTIFPIALHRGRRVASFLSYKALLIDAQFRAQQAGYPKSRWMDLFDWNRTS